jgi:hypothetical protein
VRRGCDVRRVALIGKNGNWWLQRRLIVSVYVLLDNAGVWKPVRGRSVRDYRSRLRGNRVLHRVARSLRVR